MHMLAVLQLNKYFLFIFIIEKQFNLAKMFAGSSVYGNLWRLRGYIDTYQPDWGLVSQAWFVLLVPSWQTDSGSPWPWMPGAPSPSVPSPSASPVPSLFPSPSLVLSLAPVLAHVPAPSLAPSPVPFHALVLSPALSLSLPHAPSLFHAHVLVHAPSHAAAAHPPSGA